MMEETLLKLLVFVVEKGLLFVKEAFQFIYGLESISSIMLYTAYSSLMLLAVCIFIFNNYFQSSRTDDTEDTDDEEERLTCYILVFGGQNSGKTTTLESIAKKEIKRQHPICPNLKYKYDDVLWWWRIVAAKWKNVPQLRSDHMEDIQTFSDNLAIMKKYLGNFHVFILCLPLHKILTNSFEEYIKALKSVCGPSIFKQIIVAFTHCDIYLASHSKFDEWLDLLGPPVLKDVLKECENRYIFLHETGNGEMNTEQHSKVIKLCLDIVYKNLLNPEPTEILQNQSGVPILVPLSDPFLTEKSSEQEHFKKSITPDDCINYAVNAPPKLTWAHSVERTKAVLRNPKRYLQAFIGLKKC